jgi:hypothetical protein
VQIRRRKKAGKRTVNLISRSQTTTMRGKRKSKSKLWVKFFRILTKIADP